MAITFKKRSIHELKQSHVDEARSAPSTPGERPIKKRRIDYLTDKAESGNFYRADFAYATCAEDGRRYRVNGNHSSTVLANCIRSDEMPDFPEGIPLVIEEWEVDTIAELADVFDNYDNPVSNRSAGDKLGVHLANYSDDLVGVNQKVANSALKGINLARKQLRDPDKPPVKVWDLGDLLSLDPRASEFCRFMQGFFGLAWDGWKLPPVVAAIYIAWCEGGDEISPLWFEVFDEENEDENSDTRKFVNSMRTATGKKIKTPDWFFNQTLSFWKRHRRAVAS